MSQNKDFHYIVPVWGNEYVDLFVNTCLPMLIKLGNIHRDVCMENDSFIIVTAWHSLNRIKSSTAFKELSSIISVKFYLIDGLVDLSKTHRAMSCCYALAMQKTNVIEGGTYFIFLTPDSFWPKGTFQKLKELANKNYYVAMAMGLRLRAETAVAAINEMLSGSNTSHSLNNQNLFDLVINNLHKMNSALDLLSGEPFSNLLPSHLYWINHQEKQITAHCFHLHPLMVLARTKKTKIGISIDGDFVKNLRYPPDKFYIFQNEYYGIELTKQDRDWTHRLEAASMQKIIKFSRYEANKLHKYFFRHRIQLGNTNNPLPTGLNTLIDSTVNNIPYMQKRSLKQRIIDYMLLYIFYFIKITKTTIRRVIRPAQIICKHINLRI